MLSYAFAALKQSNYDEIATESFDNVHNLFAAILAKGIGQQLKQGLYREYLEKSEDLTQLRSKINMPGTIKNKMARRLVLTCDYDELSENNLFNQVLKTTVMILLRHANVKAEHKDALKKEMLYFANVDILDPATISWANICFHRNNQTYRMLLSLCQFVLEGLLLTTESGKYRLATFFDEQSMSRLYEKFILEYYKQEHPELTASASSIAWALDDDMKAMLPLMFTDITLSKGSSVLIIDAKYYAQTTQERYGTHTIHSHNLYQIFAYVKNKALEFAGAPYQVSGLLLYAKTDKDIQPDYTYQMSGNKISVKILNLNREFSEIAGQLSAIVAEHFNRC